MVAEAGEARGGVRGAPTRAGGGAAFFQMQLHGGIFCATIQATTLCLRAEEVTMEERFIGLIYPNEESRRRHLSGEGLPEIGEEVCTQLGLDSLLSLRAGSLCDFFTQEPEVILYRQSTLSDMREVPELAATLGKVVPVLCDIEELRRLDRDRGVRVGDSYLYSITEIELYVSCITLLYEGLAPVAERLKSPAFLSLWEFIRELSESEYYQELNRRLKELSRRASEVKSITLGVNLDSEFRPVEAGVLSLNAETFKSGRVLDKILRLSFKNDAMTCIAPLSCMNGERDSDNRREALTGAIYGAIEDVFHSSVRAWRGIVGSYVLDNTDFLLRLLPEIEFVTRASDLEARLTRSGNILCVPEIAPMEENAFVATGLYNPDVALRIEEKVVPNDLAFDEAAGLYVLTGPNRGGKSVITCALGLAQAMAQLGLSVAADACRLSPVDGIFTHFPEGAEDTIDKGRLGEECARLKEIFLKVTSHSMILLDESLSSTGAYEASYIAAEILTGFATVGCRGIFSTHLHDLAAAIPEINARARAEGGVAIDTLVAGIEEGRRSFVITRATPDGKSYARDIADKYGLSFEALKKQIK